MSKGAAAEEIVAKLRKVQGLVDETVGSSRSKLIR